jgi:isoquinoline 1-oxidoreductase alpha subunit
LNLNKESSMMPTIRFNLNHQAVSLKADGERKLLWVLRTDLALTGANYGCDEGLGGACTVLVNEEAVQTAASLMKGGKPG